MKKRDEGVGAHATSSFSRKPRSFLAQITDDEVDHSGIDLALHENSNGLWCKFQWSQ